MSEPKFNNRENKCYKTEDGDIWFSRSVALLGIKLFFMPDKKTRVLVEKRSEKMDAPGLWCVPCGYIDWEEDGIAGLNREVWEETGLYLPDIDKFRFNQPNIPIGTEEQPFYVHTQPGENRQNITLCYLRTYNMSEASEKDLDNLWAVERFKNDEIDTVKLIETGDLYKYPWAFDHDKRIEMAVDESIRKVENDRIYTLGLILSNQIDAIKEDKIKEAEYLERIKKLPWYKRYFKQLLWFWGI